MGEARESRIRKAIEILEAQACNCLDSKGRAVRGKAKVRVLCLRCELLELLR